MSDAATKTCSKCGEVKAVESFSKKQRYCKVCASQYFASWRLVNHEKTASYSKNWRLANREKALKATQNWAQANPDKKKASETRITKFHVDTLSEKYVKTLISRRTDIPHADIPVELIEVKRKHLQILRAIKEMKDE